MSLKITEECINCGACKLECPNNAIYEGGSYWRFSDGTNIKGKIKNKNGKVVNVNTLNQPIEKDIYFIVKEKCTECIGFYDTPQCASVCPVNCCIIDTNNIESKKELIEKSKKIHN
jgi:ferredoxin